MYKVYVKMTNTPDGIKKIYGRDNAEEFANQAYDCDNVYAVEIINADTGEVVYYKSKGL